MVVLYLIVLVTFCLLVAAVLFGISMWLPLFISLLLFVGYVWHLGFGRRPIETMLVAGVKKALIVIRVFVFIGALTAAWMAAGTIPTLVYAGIRIINPSIFILSTFLICCAMSFLLGTSFGTANTIGIVMITIAKSGGVNLFMTAAAIVCGIYFGDRCSPMSSSLILVSTLTETDQYDNVKAGLRSAVVPLCLSSLLFLVLSFLNPLHGSESAMAQEIAAQFHMGLVTLLPAIVIFVMCLMKIDVKRAMLASVAVGAVVAVAIQGESILSVANAIVMGFSLSSTSPLRNLIHGGGFVSMINAAVVVVLSCAIAGLFEGAGLLRFFMPKKAPASRADLYFRTIVGAVGTAAVGCNQTISIVMTAELSKPFYDIRGVDQKEWATDLTSTASILSAAVPWNIAVLIPVTNLGVTGVGYLPYLFFIFCMPLWRWIKFWFEGNKESK